MKFTGERVIEGHTPERIWLDHIARYRFSVSFVQKASVLDIACGTGYGCEILMKGSPKSVLGIDISDEAVYFAKKAYGRPGLDFAVGSILDIPVPDQRLDAITAFETIEHVPDPGKALSEIARTLRPGGILIISTPNRRLTSPGKSLSDRPDNAFHFIEFTRDEFLSVLSRFFDPIGLYGQRAIPELFVSPLVRKMFGRLLPWIYDPASGSPDVVKQVRAHEYRYVVAVCARSNMRRA